MREQGNIPQDQKDWKAPAEHSKPLVTRGLDNIVGKNRLQPEGRNSTVKFYGGEIKQEDGKTIFDMRGLVSNFDRIGDVVVRAGDDHVIKNPVKMLIRHPKAALKAIMSTGKRFRVFDKEKFDGHYKKFGLDDYYAGHKNGIEIKKPEILTKGYNLQDVYKMPELGIDRFAAAGEAAKYLRQLHDKANAGLGDVVVSDFIFEKKEGNKVSEPVMFIPNVIYDSEKKTSVIDQKATDLMELITSAGIEEYKQSHNWDEAKRVVKMILENYHTEADDKLEPGEGKQHLSVTAVVRSFVKRGRLNLTGEKPKAGTSKIGSRVKTVASWHNAAHMQVPAEHSVGLREVLTETLEEFLEGRKAAA